MREMFLQNGFNDFLSKPIDTSILRAILSKWIPKDKQMAPLPESTAPDVYTVPAEELLPELEGIDANIGFCRTGGNRDAYVKVLEVFRRDALNGLDTLQAQLGAGDYKNFTVHIHALKSASLTIGALELAEQAAALEKAGRDEDQDFITAHIEEFRRDMSKILKSLMLFLQKEESA
jgi:HPt (histidine-containing phosphotransfer) domain-containing protein